MYVNTYVLGVPENRKDDYVRIAKLFAEIAKDFGALELFENWQLDLPDGEQTDYRKAIKVELGEMPFDGKRMILAGFEPILTYRRD